MPTLNITLVMLAYKWMAKQMVKLQDIMFGLA